MSLGFRRFVVALAASVASLALASPVAAGAATSKYPPDAAARGSTAVSLTMDRRASVDQLLAVEGNAATYSVRLVDLDAAGESISLIEPTSLAGASAWRGVSPASVDPDDLTEGHRYRLLVTSAYTTGTSVLVRGNVDYDNVVLEAARAGRS
jgi:hypothetical protein